MRGNPVLCRCRDSVLRECWCPVHGPFVPSALDRRSAAIHRAYTDILSVRDWSHLPCDQGFSRYHDLDGNPVGKMRRVPVQGVV